jgi:hypothetical protein
MNIGDYFNLRQSISSAPTSAPPPTTSVASTTSAPQAVAAAVALAPQPTQLTVAWQLFIYAVVLSSILSSRFLDMYRAGVAGQFFFDWRYLLFVAIISLLVFPVAYDKAKLSADQPILVQVGLIFTTGMGWEKIVATVVGK